MKALLTLLSFSSLRLFSAYFIATVMLCSIMSCAGSRAKKVGYIGTSDPLTEAMVSRIQTDVDPKYVYEYEQTKFVPPAEKTLLIMGQTVEAIDEYMVSFPNQPIPGGWSAYWGITGFNGVTEAFFGPPGATHDHQMLVKRFPNTVVQSALWMVGHSNIAKNTVNGVYDSNVRQFSKWAKTTNRPIYFRIGYEFDGPHNALEPKEYVKAYQRIVDLIRAEGVDNIAFVWHSYGHAPFNGYPVSDWYPGDEYVDWVAISIFGSAYGGASLSAEGDTLLDFAKKHKKPVMIAESNPIMGIEKNNPDAWDDWFVNFFSMAYSKNIKAISFINEDWTRLNIGGTQDWKDARLYNNKQISKAWFLETNKEHYLKQSPELYKQLGYQKK